MFFLFFPFPFFFFFCHFHKTLLCTDWFRWLTDKLVWFKQPLDSLYTLLSWLKMVSYRANCSVFVNLGTQRLSTIYKIHMAKNGWVHCELEIEFNCLNHWSLYLNSNISDFILLLTGRFETILHIWVEWAIVTIELKLLDSKFKFNI